MRELRFLVPGTGRRFRCGGLAVELQTAGLTADLASTTVVTYRVREAGHAFLDDLLRAEPVGSEAASRALWIVSWGFDVPQLLRRLRGRAVAYHAHSSGYGFDLPAGVPVLAVSRNTLGYWGNRAPRSPLWLVPNALEPQWIQRGARSRPAALPTIPQPAPRRPIDVLVQQRKSSAYVLKQLVPALRARGLVVEVQSGWVDDLVALFNSAAVVLYDSADYWRGRGVSEGFGLPPIEALACGCVVFSSLNHALADCLDPGVLGHQLGLGTLAADVERIVAAARDPARWQADPLALERLLDELGEARLKQRWAAALEAINGHWDRLLQAGEPPLRSPSPLQVRLTLWRQTLARLLKRLR
ncbi:MAG: glycosyltransferase [Cyanobacteria bacterium M_surface_7_m2_040]|nr:glycosyltransferase [Cyanobacteria bacterium M_surface_7_m2_040]